MTIKNQKRVAHDLQFNVSQLLKEATGATRLHDVEARVLEQLDDDASLVSPIQGQVRFLRAGTEIMVVGTLQATVEKTCGRCLKTFIAPVSIELEEQFYPTIDIINGNILTPPPEADEANRIDEQHTLDLLEVVRQEFLLQTVPVRYCSPDCKGLCPHCGQNRNLNPCDCQNEAIDVRWSALLALQEE